MSFITYHYAMFFTRSMNCFFCSGVLEKKPYPTMARLKRLLKFLNLPNFCVLQVTLAILVDVVNCWESSRPRTALNIMIGRFKEGWKRRASTRRLGVPTQEQSSELGKRIIHCIFCFHYSKINIFLLK